MDTLIPFSSAPCAATTAKAPQEPTRAPASRQLPNCPHVAPCAPEASPFVLSIEAETGRTPALHGFHLGTNADLARHIAALHWHGRRRWGLPVVTVALMRDGKLFATYDGHTWQG